MSITSSITVASSSIEVEVTRIISSCAPLGEMRALRASRLMVELSCPARALGLKLPARGVSFSDMLSVLLQDSLNYFSVYAMNTMTAQESCSFWPDTLVEDNSRKYMVLGIQVNRTGRSCWNLPQ